MCRNSAICRHGPETDLTILLFIHSVILIMLKLLLFPFYLTEFLRLFLQAALSNHQMN